MKCRNIYQVAAYNPTRAAYEIPADNIRSYWGDDGSNWLAINYAVNGNEEQMVVIYCCLIAYQSEIYYIVCDWIKLLNAADFDQTKLMDRITPSCVMP